MAIPQPIWPLDGLCSDKPMRIEMNSKQRVLAAFRFEPSDRIPRFDNFWEYPTSWAERFGPAGGLTDIRIWVPNEGTFPTRAGQIRETGDWVYQIDTWGRTYRQRKGAYFTETLDVPIPKGMDPDRVVFDPPDLDDRYRKAATLEQTQAQLKRDKERYCVFGKTGGPYLRTTFVRGEEQFLIDIAADPSLARALVDKMADHLIGIAREQIRRWGLHDTGVWIYDDMAFNDGPMFSPRSFEQILLPAYRRMIQAYKDAGARYVVLHSDGNILPILEMLVDAGIDGLHPLERRAGMLAPEIRKRYPQLVLAGGMCNTETLVEGPPARIERETRELIELGREGGMIIGTHSISPEIPLEHFEVYHRTCVMWGAYRY